MLTINKKVLFLIISVLAALVTLSTLLNTSNYLFSFFVFLFFVTIPGLLILFMIKDKLRGLWTFLVYSIGISLSFLIFTGLLFNYVGYGLLHSPALDKERLSIFYFIIISLLITISYIKSKNLSLRVDLTKVNFYKLLFYGYPVLILLISTLGTIFLNNTGNNILTLAALFGIVISLLVTILFYQKVNENFLPYSIYFYGLSILLMLSLRSLYVSGWDIQSEFHVFQLTKNLGYWSPNNADYAYNACLSITLLPTIISRLTSFPDDYIFKLLYQLLFAIAPLVVFLNFKKFAHSIIAYFAVVYIIAQPLFIQPMTALMRQEIAFIFFILMIFTLFNKELKTKIRVPLFLLFGLSMVVSHYSTTYIAIIILFSTYVLISIFRISEKITIISYIYRKLKISHANIRYEYFLTPISLLLLFLSTMFWYGYINNQLGSVKNAIVDSVSQMNDLFRTESLNNESLQALPILGSSKTSQSNLEIYTKDALSNIGDTYNLYPKSSYASSNVIPITSTSVSPIFLSPFNNYIFVGFDVLKQIFKFSVILGPFFLFIKFFKDDTFPREYIAYCIISVFLVIFMTISPSIGLLYNLSRLYLQLLFYIALPAILLVTFVLLPTKKYSIIIVCVMITLLFGYLTSIPNQLLGGEASMYLNNFGTDYDKFYVHKDELVSAQWMEENVSNKSTVFADREADLRIYRIGDRSINFNILPALIYRDAYVYGSYGNIVDGRAIIHDQGRDFMFSFPTEFLNNNKSLIYSNGGSEIFR